MHLNALLLERGQQFNSVIITGFIEQVTACRSAAAYDLNSGECECQGSKSNRGNERKTSSYRPRDRDNFHGAISARWTAPCLAPLPSSFEGAPKGQFLKDFSRMYLSKSLSCSSLLFIGDKLWFPCELFPHKYELIFFFRVDKLGSHLPFLLPLTIYIQRCVGGGVVLLVCDPQNCESCSALKTNKFYYSISICCLEATSSDQY